MAFLDFFWRHLTHTGYPGFDNVKITRWVSYLFSRVLGIGLLLTAADRVSPTVTASSPVFWWLWLVMSLLCGVSLIVHQKTAPSLAPNEFVAFLADLFADRRRGRMNLLDALASVDTSPDPVSYEARMARLDETELLKAKFVKNAVICSVPDFLLCLWAALVLCGVTAGAMQWRWTQVLVGLTALIAADALHVLSRRISGLPLAAYGSNWG